MKAYFRLNCLFNAYKGTQKKIQLFKTHKLKVLQNHS